MSDQISFSCPIPMPGYDKITLAHGGGGSFSYKLLHELIFKYLNSEPLATEHDGAVVEINGVKLAFSTDSYVIDPVFFPGGNIGELAVYGTVNDIACCGAKPLFLSLSLIIEEGLPVEQLEIILASVRRAADRAGVSVVTGDTKVVGHGKGDKIFVNTSGVGLVYTNTNISPRRAEPGDAVLLSGT
ncbi:MAG: hydrogenase expression/formation protein HypE, partial [Bacteroidales bacterium]|nr:hydrogenase expression/formation protein HypE [Bacteroidales bacterium]